MSYTILTIPFNLEETNGKFAIDEFFDFEKSQKSKSSAFLHHGEFDTTEIARALVCVFLKNIAKPNALDLTQTPDFINDNHKVVFKDSSFRDQKYLDHIIDFTDSLVLKDQKTQPDKTDSVGSIAGRLLSRKIKFSFDRPDDEAVADMFKIDSIKLFFNRSAFNPQVGFGFASIVLEWDADNAYDMLKTLSKVKNNLRYFANKKESSFNFYLSTNDLFNDHLKRYAFSLVDTPIEMEDKCESFNCTISKKNVTIKNQLKGSTFEFYRSNENKLQLNSELLTTSPFYPGDEEKYFKLSESDKLLRVESMGNLKLDFKPLRTDKGLEGHDDLTNSTKSIKEIFGLRFNTLIEELLRTLFKQKDPKSFLNFSHDAGYVKPHFLHLSIQQKNSLENKLDKQLIFDVLRIPDLKNEVINNWEFIPDTPDAYVSMYTLNEGAFILEGKNDENPKSRSKELINKYYPAVLFALNQKYLFHHFQGKIGDLKVNGEDFEAESLKSMKAMMIKGEFYQVFTLISNYNEIDSFFQNLRAKFNIKELKEEYLDSINGLEKLASLEAEKKEKKEKLESEDREKLRSERIDNAVILLTFAQVIAIYFAIVDDFKIVFLSLVTLVLILSLDALFNEKSLLQKILNYLKKKTDI